VNGNIQTPSLIIEQGAVFEGSCKMLQMSQAAEKTRKDGTKREEPLDTSSSMQPISADGSKSSKITNVPNVPNVSSVAS
jgi:cytoskeletal protein CcmA (bactofilin family)